MTRAGWNIKFFEWDSVRSVTSLSTGSFKASSLSSAYTNNQSLSREEAVAVSIQTLSEIVERVSPRRGRSNYECDRERMRK